MLRRFQANTNRICSAPMLSTFAITVPFFALILLGYLAARRGMLSNAAIPGLNVFVLYFALPCALFRFGMNTPVLQLLGPGVLAIYALCALLMIAAYHRTDLARPGEPEGCRIRGPGRCLSQYRVYGAAVADIVGRSSGCGYDDLDHRCRHLPDQFSMHRACAVAGRGQARPPRRNLTALRGVALNPLPWAIALGAASSATGLKPVGPIDAIVRMLADAATPVALFTIGAVLWLASRYAHTRTACFSVLAGRAAQTSCASDVGGLCRKGRPGARRRDIRL